MLRDFNSSATCRVICIPRSTSTVGVNLQCATHLVVPEPLWDVNDFEQTLGRIERPFGVDANSKVEVCVLVADQTSLHQHYQRWVSDTSSSRKWTNAHWRDDQFATGSTPTPLVRFPTFPTIAFTRTFVYLPFRSTPGGLVNSPPGDAKPPFSIISFDDYVRDGFNTPIHELLVPCMFRDRKRYAISFVRDGHRWVTRVAHPIVSIDCRNPHSVLAYDKDKQRLDLPYIKFTASFRLFGGCKVGVKEEGQNGIQYSSAALHGASTLKWKLQESRIWIRFLDVQEDTNSIDCIRPNFAVNVPVRQIDATKLLGLNLKADVQNDSAVDAMDAMDAVDAMDANAVNHCAFFPFASFKYKKAVPIYNPDTHSMSLATGLFVESGFDLKKLGIQTEFVKFENPADKVRRYYDVCKPEKDMLVNHGDDFTSRIALSYLDLHRRKSGSMSIFSGVYEAIEHSVRYVPALLKHDRVRIIMCRERFGAHSFMCDRKQARDIDMTVRKVRKLLPSGSDRTIYMKFSDRDHRQGSAARDLVSLSLSSPSSSSSSSGAGSDACGTDARGPVDMPCDDDYEH